MDRGTRNKTSRLTAKAAWLGLPLLAAVCLACGDGGGSAAPARETAAGGGNAVPVIRSVSLLPNPPVPGEAIRAIVSAADPDGPAPHLQFSWSVRGRPVGGGGDSIVLPELHKGDRVAVTVIARDALDQSDPVAVELRVPNSRPRILDLALRRETRSGVDHWVVEPLAEDPDGDALNFEYTWLLNGRESDQRSDAFAVGALARGDRLAVRVVASDGESETAPLTSAPVEIANSAPEITSRPSGLDEGGEFHYQIEASDADGDRNLVIELVEGPDGMTLDALSGELHWAPRPDQEGKHRVEIAVNDRRGGRSQQVFILPVKTRLIDPAEEGDDASPAAPAR